MAKPKFSIDANGNPLEFYGVKIVINDQIVRHSFKRSWLKRLFTRPFRPFKKYEVITHKVVPDGKYRYTSGLIMLNSFTYKKLRCELERREF